jgi:hypothetical protein
MFSFIGRGVCKLKSVNSGSQTMTNSLPVYIFLGSLMVSDSVLSKIAGSIVGITGIAYVALEFVPSIEPPANMREAEDAGWGAEQV